VEADSSEKAWILKDQGAVSGVKDKVIVFGGQVVGTLGGEFSGHAKVDAQPAVGTKAKEHLFPMSLDRPERLSGQGRAQAGAINIPKNPFPVVQVNAQHLFVQRRGPAAAEIENLGKFRHQGRVGAAGENSKLGWGEGSDILSGWRQS